MEEHYSVNYVPSVWPSSLPMNALNVGHGVCVCASSWPIITDQKDTKKIFSGASKFVAFL